LGSKFFSHRTPGRPREVGGEVPPSEIALEVRDHQQALVLDALRRAAGAPVSYAELREAGIDLPASVVSELELAGVAIERCVGAGRGVVGVRLDPANEPGGRPTPDPAEPRVPTETEPESAWSSVRVHRASSLEGLVLSVLGWLSAATRKGNRGPRRRTTRRGPATPARAAMATGTYEARLVRKPFRVNPRRRVLALAAVLAGIALVSSFVAISSQGGGRRAPVSVAKRHHPRVAVVASAARPRTTRTPTHPPPVPVSPALATELEAQGHILLEAGRYGDAVPVLERAVLATGETLGACLEPANTTCLTYAYALYDLGRAERLSGEPQAAVPILERRLQIDNQRSTVGAELQLARQGIG
jgi:hypothetical protein